MNAQPHEIAAIESLLAFWRDAGVDACYGEAPVDHTHLAPPPALKAVQKATASVAAPLAGPGAAEAIAEARHLAAGAATLQDLAAAVAAFEGCPLRAMGATQSVFGRGDPNAPVLIIGEGPGAEEDRMGQPFVGKAGKLLDRMLAAAGLTGKVFITNTVFWRPPGNRTPTPQEQAVCAPFVERAFALLQPRAVLLLGAASAKSVLQTEEGIMKIRGQWREWRLNEGAVSAPVVPTLHPAFLLRQPQAKRLVWGDLLALSARLDGAG
ncbi:uracil-DNA glycosylase family protein [Brevundimonas sp. Bb-A]|uniref:uracil-DNA glycosylase n=1 Tax=Brevundimonas sp. Bb-A TaxID=2560058 RepID=UPI00128EFC29|nr:uracil-DNA glycosylase [Brevundimonas sp. Bb-A]MED5538299.1 uracil-DNA glycosylase [Pseudomonadota bacterium]QFU32923.1 Uracil DNA glycosylase superfamily protein [Brevundimonas sp. Bb-A]